MKTHHLVDKLKAQRQKLGGDIYILASVDIMSIGMEILDGLDKEHQALIDEQDAAMERIKLLNEYNNQ